MRAEGPLRGASVALVAAHPDDEAIGSGGHLSAFRNLRIVHVSDGAPRDPSFARASGCATREEYACLRRRELLEALALAGIAPPRAAAAGFVDQEAALHMAALALLLAGAIRRAACDVVLTHPYEGGHPDHDATAFAVHAACALLHPAPAIWEFTSYHERGGSMRVFEFLGEPGAAVALSPDQRELKRRMYVCFRSQKQMLENFPIATERFRRAPCYNFRRPPHEGKLFYENFAWGMTGERWRALARGALKELRIDDRL